MVIRSRASTSSSRRSTPRARSASSWSAISHGSGARPFRRSRRAALGARRSPALDDAARSARAAAARTCLAGPRPGTVGARIAGAGRSAVARLGRRPASRHLMRRVSHAELEPRAATARARIDRGVHAAGVAAAGVTASPRIDLGSRAARVDGCARGGVGHAAALARRQRGASVEAPWWGRRAASSDVLADGRATDLARAGRGRRRAADAEHDRGEEHEASHDAPVVRLRGSVLRANRTSSDPRGRSAVRVRCAARPSLAHPRRAVARSRCGNVRSTPSTRPRANALGSTGRRPIRATRTQGVRGVYPRPSRTRRGRRTGQGDLRARSFG